VAHPIKELRLTNDLSTLPEARQKAQDFTATARTSRSKGELSPFDVGSKLNEIPFSSLDYRNPREVFKALDAGQPGLASEDA
jgi:hypothetical protein